MNDTRGHAQFPIIRQVHVGQLLGAINQVQYLRPILLQLLLRTLRGTHRRWLT